jgi:riboflavin kinase/FMN adenylyltransferase
MIIVNNEKEREEKEWLATVGFFDGVHAGHRFLIGEMRRLAEEKGLSTAVFTFPVHPRIVLQSDYRPKLLNSPEEKLKLLATTGVDYCVMMDFTPELAACPASDFITTILSQQWHVRCLLTGHDNRFGHSRTDGFEQYVEYGKACGMEIMRTSSYVRDKKAVSSSQIRQLLSECRVEEAAGLLTYPYRLKGHIVSGHQVGRTLGYPTANIEMDDPYKVWPGMGVYAVWTYVDDKRYKGMLTIGDRPTLNGDRVGIEVHLLHFSETVYKQSIEVEFMHYLRENVKFENAEALKVQLNKDRQKVDKLLGTDFHL